MQATSAPCSGLTWRRSSCSTCNHTPAPGTREENCASTRLLRSTAQRPAKPRERGGAEGKTFPPEIPHTVLNASAAKLLPRFINGIEHAAPNTNISGARGETPPLSPWEQFGGTSTRLRTSSHSRATCEGGNNSVFLLNSVYSVIMEAAEKPRYPRTSLASPPAKPRSVCWQRALPRERRSRSPARPQSRPGTPSQAAAPHQRRGHPSCHPPGTGSAAATPVPSPRGHRYVLPAPVLEPGSPPVPVQRAWTRRGSPPGDGLSWPGGAGSTPGLGGGGCLRSCSPHPLDLKFSQSAHTAPRNRFTTCHCEDTAV